MSRQQEQRRTRIAALMIQAEAERATFGHLVAEYSHITGPFDRFYTRALNFTQARPLTTTLLLSLGGFGMVMLGRRLPRLPLSGLTRGTMLAAAALRALRRYRQNQNTAAS
jgi:hypothetical protein